jgi:uncharacterized protein YkwD
MGLPAVVRLGTRLGHSAAAVGAACAVTLVLAPAAVAASACQAANAMPDQVATRTIGRATVCVLNAARARHGLRPLAVDRHLSEAAGRHARDMARRKYFSHVSLDGATFVDRIRRTGYLIQTPSWTLGENLAWGAGRRSSSAAIVAAWMGSDDHRANILNRSFREIGIGVAYGAPNPVDGQPAAIFAADFGARG